VLKEIELSLDTLSMSWKDVPDRQRSLKATFDYSWRLLRAEDQSALKRLSLFRQGFHTREGLKVAGAAQNNLQSLIDASLVQPIAEDRYWMHDQVRSFAQEKLIENPAECLESYQLFSEVYLSALVNWDQGMRSAEQAATFFELDHEIENARQAWDWRIKNGNLEGLEEAVMGLCRYYQLRKHYQDGREVCESTLDMIKKEGLSKENIRLWARCSVWWDQFTSNLDRVETTPELSEEVCRILSSAKWAKVNTLWEQAFVHQYLGNIRMRNYPWRDTTQEEYPKHIEIALKLFRDLGDDWNVAVTLLIKSIFLDANFLEYRRAAEESLEIMRKLGDQSLLGEIYYNLACSYLFGGNLDEGIQVMRLAVSYIQQTTLPTRAAKALLDISVALTWAGRFEEGLKLSLQSLEIFTKMGLDMPVNGAAIICAQYLFLGKYDAYFRRVEEFDLPRTGRGFYLMFGGAAFLITEEINKAEQVLMEALEFHLKIGDMRLIVYFRALLSAVYYQRGNLPLALDTLEEAVQGWSEGMNILAKSHLMLMIAFYLANLGKLEKAVEIYEATLRYPILSNSAWAEDFAGKKIKHKIASLPAVQLEGARCRGKGLSDWQAVSEGIASLRRKG
jgi:tetratricopeptide (TPR) repeat protein